MQSDQQNSLILVFQRKLSGSLDVWIHFEQDTFKLIKHMMHNK